MLPETANTLSFLQGKIREDMNNYADDTATGVPGDFAAYQRLVGKIEGLAIAERHLLDMVDRAKRGEDDAD
jgi:hypothetical protein